MQDNLPTIEEAPSAASHGRLDGLACLSIDVETDPASDNRIFKLGAVRSDSDAALSLDTGRPPRAKVVDRLNELLVPALLGRARVRIQQPLIAADESEPEPDVAVVAPGSYARSHPEGAKLVIEVAHSSIDYDRVTKAPLYAASGVEEYWLVDVEGRRVEVFCDASGGTYRSVERFGAGAVLRPRAFPDVAVTLDALFD